MDGERNQYFRRCRRSFILIQGTPVPVGVVILQAGAKLHQQLQRLVPIDHGPASAPVVKGGPRSGNTEMARCSASSWWVYLEWILLLPWPVSFWRTSAWTSASASHDANVCRRLWNERLALIPPGSITSWATPALFIMRVKVVLRVPETRFERMGNKSPCFSPIHARQGGVRGTVMVFLLRFVFCGRMTIFVPFMCSRVRVTTSPSWRPVCAATRITPCHSAEVCG